MSKLMAKFDRTLPHMNRWFHEFMDGGIACADVITPEGKAEEYAQHYSERYGGGQINYFDEEQRVFAVDFEGEKTIFFQDYIDYENVCIMDFREIVNEKPSFEV